MTTPQVVETSVTVNNNSPFHDYVHLDDQTQPTFEMTLGFKPFTIWVMLDLACLTGGILVFLGLAPGEMFFLYFCPPPPTTFLMVHPSDI